MKFIILFLLTTLSLNATAFDEIALKSGNSLISTIEKTPTQNLLISFPFGSSDIKAKHQGTLNVMANILDKGPKTMSEYDYAQKLFQTNSTISFKPGNKTFNIIIKTQKENLPGTLDLLIKILNSPNINLKNFEQARLDHLTARTSAFSDMRSTIFYYGFRDAVNFHPLSLNGSGSPKTIKRISYKSVEKYLKKLDINTATFYGLGPVDSNVIAKTLNSKLMIGSANNVKKYPQILSKGQSVTLLNKPKATDHQLLMATGIKLKPYTPEYVVAEVALNILGGGLSGRLSKTLRVERGLTYHAGSYIRPLDKETTLLFIWTFGGTKQYPKLLSGIPEVINKLLKDGFSKEEMSSAKQSLKTRFKENTELPKDRLEFITEAKIHGYPKEALNNYLQNLSAVTDQQVMDFLKKKVKVKMMSTYSMGDKKVLAPMFKSKIKNLSIDNIE